MPECNCKAFNNDFEFQHESRSIVPFKDKDQIQKSKFLKLEKIVKSLKGDLKKQTRLLEEAI